MFWDLTVKTFASEQLASSILMMSWLDDALVLVDCPLDPNGFPYLSFSLMWLFIYDFCIVTFNSVILSGDMIG